MDTAVRYEMRSLSYIPLPTEIKKYKSIVLPSFTKMLEQVEIHCAQRLIDIINPNPKTIEALTNLSLRPEWILM